MKESVEQESGAKALTSAIFESEEAQRADQAARNADVVLPDDLLPGVNDEPMSFREALRSGGVRMVLVLFLLNVIDDLPRTIRVLAPDIQETLGINDTTLQGVLGFGGVALVLGSIPAARLADRVRRVSIIPIASFAWAMTLAVTGAVVNAFQLFWANVATGLGQSYRIPVSNSLLADQYPIQARNRVFGAEGLGRPLGQILGPLLIGGLATVIGGPESWRWVFPILAIPPVVLGLASLALREPRRGGHEQRAVLGGELTPSERELPVSITAAFGRLKKVKSFYFLFVGVGTLGFALVAVPLQFNLLLEDRYGYDALDRGIVEALIWLTAFAVVPLASSQYDKRFRTDPSSVMRIAGYLVVASGVVLAVGLPIKPIITLTMMMSIAQALTTAAFVATGSIISAVAPFRMRAQAFALLPVSIFLMGGFFGGLLVGALSDVHGNRTAMLIVAPAASIMGGALIVYGSRYVRRDISLAVDELLEEQNEAQRLEEADADVPVLQVRNLDVSYGNLQVLFDVDLEVHAGETLALLGTNGAGKSTALKTISGLLLPSRGVIRLNGQTVTFVDAETRHRIGIVQVRGGEALWPSLTIGEHLDIWSWSVDDPTVLTERLDSIRETFSIIGERPDQKAGSLSGGQQQQLALAKALIADPELLLIDELSLGFAPVIVQDLLEVIESLKAQGQTMVIVEQSVNIGLSIAARAIFMERGRVQFTGPAQDLLERDDLLRAVFLSGEEA